MTTFVDKAFPGQLVITELLTPDGKVLHVSRFLAWLSGGHCAFEALSQSDLDTYLPQEPAPDAKYLQKGAGSREGRKPWKYHCPAVPGRLQESPKTNEWPGQSASSRWND